MEIFNAVSKQIDSLQGVGQDYSSSISQAKKAEQLNTVTASSEVKNQKDKAQIKEQLDNTVKKLNAQMDALSINIKFGFNDKLDTLYVNVTEKSTGRLIRKIPSEEAMKLAEKMKEVIGMIFDKKG